uniref:Protein kinase domain-containing protein n=1 Tax=Oryza glumipatula TaxID=40148 RepID=A0A0E0BQF8_9ORYZ
MALWGGLGQAATVAQLVGADVGGLISTIIQAAAAARQNKEECEKLARLVVMIADMLQDAKVRQPLAGLEGTLREAHELVAYCQRRSRAYLFFRARAVANKLRDVQSSIDSYLQIFAFTSHIELTRRLNQIRDLLTPCDTPALLSPSPSAGRSDTPQFVDAANIIRRLSHTVQEFTFEELVAATDNFAQEIGRGGFGTVCLGVLVDGREVVIKRKTMGSKSEEEFLAEVTILSQLRHRHIVRLLGWCVVAASEEEDEEERLLVMEYMNNGSLYDHLHSALPKWSSSPVRASWRMRIEILLGVSRAIEYLHSYTVPPVIHRDIKPSNILLDSSWAPRLSDFGTAVSCDDAERCCVVAGLTPKGTPGYFDPEYSSTRVLKPTSDIYSSGVVMLEVLTGKKAMLVSEKKSLVCFALPIIQANKVWKVMDCRPAMEPTPRQFQAANLVAETAARCLLLKGDKRPDISEVVARLETALDLVRSDGR